MRKPLFYQKKAKQQVIRKKEIIRKNILLEKGCQHTEKDASHKISRVNRTVTMRRDSEKVISKEEC